MNIYYDTPDGTSVRDYIHVVDLSLGHIKVIEKIRKIDGVEIYNLGTGNGFSVLELVHTFEKVNNVKVNYQIVGRRQGDIAVCNANCDKALKELGWKWERNIEDMCRDTWNFILKNKKN